MVFDIVSIEISEELFEPLVHDLMVLPSMFEFRQENSSALARFVSKRWENIFRQVSLNCLAVSLIQLTGPVVRRALCTHVIAGTG